MKKNRIPAVLIAVFAILLLGSCDMINNFIASRMRNIAVIQIYNSNREKTNKLQPNDTLYVEVQGLAPLGYYQIEALDPEGNVITMLTAQADENGVIAPSPLWYDVGFKKVYDATWNNNEGRWWAVLPDDSELGLNAFNIHVVSLDTGEKGSKALTMTDFKLPFFVVFKTDISRPQPIVMASKNVDGAIYLENRFDAGDELWIQVANLEPLLETDNTATTTMTAYIVPFDAAVYESGYSILSNFVAKQTFTIDQLRAGVKFTADSETWTGLGPWTTIPVGAQGRSFSVFIDVDNNGVFDILKEGTKDFYLDGVDSNGVAGFIVTKPTPPDPPAGIKRYVAGNVASGGVTWGHFWFENWPDHDYRDEFYSDGWDTQYGWDWQYSGYGVKALWNPYVYNDIDNDPNTDNTLYYGRYVDVYVVEASTLDLTGVNNLVPGGGTVKMNMPVQYACTNGANQQTIFRAPMPTGHYAVVVDINMDGKVSDGDLVDVLDENGNPRKVTIGGVDYPSGFSVINR
ncbi:MAG TPA: hypothetical protein VIO60_07455 [Rectinemataceae bacterium]